MRQKKDEPGLFGTNMVRKYHSVTPHAPQSNLTLLRVISDALISAHSCRYEVMQSCMRCEISVKRY